MSQRDKTTIFLAGIMQGSIADKQIHTQSWRDEISALLKKHLNEPEIYCHYAANKDSLNYGENRVLNTFEDGTRKAAQSDLVICYLPQASMGTAIEMYMAYKAGSTVVSITPMAINWVVQICSDHIVADFDEFEQLLTTAELQQTLENKAKQKSSGGAIGKQLPYMDEFWQDGNDR